MEHNEENATMNIEDIKMFLPHRYPFLMVDKVADWKPHEYIVAHKMVSINEPYFQGHFENKAVMPGVLILESMVQASSILALKSTQHDIIKKSGTLEWQKLASLKDNISFAVVGIDHVRFRGSVHPGDCLIIKGTYKNKLNFAQFDVETHVEDQLICSAKFTSVVYSHGDTNNLLNSYGYGRNYESND